MLKACIAATRGSFNRIRHVAGANVHSRLIHEPTQVCPQMAQDWFSHFAQLTCVPNAQHSQNITEGAHLG